MSQSHDKRDNALSVRHGETLKRNLEKLPVGVDVYLRL